MALVSDAKKLATLLLLALTALVGCAPKVTAQKPRFFWPPPPAEARIEFVDYFQSTKDVDRESGSWLEDFFLGEEEPEPIFNNPMDIASDGRRVMVTDGGFHRVMVIDRVTRQLRQLKSASGENFLFSAPYGVTIDPQGNAYVTDTSSSKLFVFGPDETLQKVIGDEELTRPTGVAVDPSRGRIYVVDTAEHQVVGFDLRGKKLFAWGERGLGEGKFNFPTDIDVDAEGNLYVLDSLNAKVQVLDQNGVFLRAFGERGSALGSFQVPKGLSVSPTGLVVVTDSLAKRFVIFNTKGDYLLSVGGRQLFDGTVSPGGFYLPMGIDIDQNSTIWIVDALNRIANQYQYLTGEYLAAHPISPKDTYVPQPDNK